MINCLYVSVHETLEWQELSLFAEFPEMNWFSMGAYTYPEGHPTLKRPSVPLKFNQELAEWSRTFPVTNIPQEFLDRFDLIYVMHDPQVIVQNWDKLKSKKVIWRSIGQSTAECEKTLKPMVEEGLKIVRMSKMEENIFGYLGGTLIPFYVDPTDLSDYNGKEKRAINLTQTLKGRRAACHYDSITQILEGFPSLVYGTGNSDLGGLNGGELTFDLMKGALRDNRVFVYGGTFPSPYTMALQEAMCTGIPVVALGRKLAEDIQVAPEDKYHYYEIPDIINGKNGFISDSIEELRGKIQELLDNENLAKQMGTLGRETAIELWGKPLIKSKWKEFFDAL